MIADTIARPRNKDGPRSAYMPETAEILRVRPMTELDTLLDVRRKNGIPLGHSPGQFVQVSILGVGECPISICSSPTQPDMFQLCVRRVGEVTGFIHRLKVGDPIGIRGPLGHGFNIHELHGHDMLIIAGGCALAPARSLIQYILDRRGDFGRFDLLYGGRSPRELLFYDELVEWQRSDAVNCHVIVDHPGDTWKGRTGVVTKLFDELAPLDLDRTRVAVIGPPIMFKFVMMEVLARGIPQSHIYCSLERRMKCGIGKCGHCQVNDAYACLDGPVFNYSRLTELREALE
ncbi:MAG: FAD/NAD(P)-binding protein [Planctomycetota bacterium]